MLLAKHFFPKTLCSAPKTFPVPERELECKVLCEAGCVKPPSGGGTSCVQKSMEKSFPKPDMEPIATNPKAYHFERPTTMRTVLP